MNVEDSTPTDIVIQPQKKIELDENALTVLRKRYLLRGQDGQPAETPEEMFWRIASVVAEPDAEYEDGTQAGTTARAFFELLTTFRFMPNSPTFTGAGTPLGQLAACFVLPIQDDMGRDPAGIFSTLRVAALIQQTGGGNGFSFSRLRPKGARVTTSRGLATGPVGFLRVYDKAFGEIAQGGTRRGANMAVLRVDHPDILEFIHCKSLEDEIVNFNISVGVTDAFMQAVEADEDYDLVNPRMAVCGDGCGRATCSTRLYGTPTATGNRASCSWRRPIVATRCHTCTNWKPRIPAVSSGSALRELLPGLRQPGTARTRDGGINWAKLQETVELATRFLDNVVDANQYVPAVPEIEEAARRARRIGLGIMGLGDLMFRCGIRYGSQEGQEFAAQIMEFVRYHAVRTSVDLARKRGPFPAIEGSIYDPENLRWRPPTPLVPYVHDFGRPALDWGSLVHGIQNHGIRNAAQTTVAPTGTIATVSGCEAYGCEPAFALAYVRHFKDGEDDVELTYTSPCSCRH